MDICRLPGDEAALRRFIEDLWLPYNRELEGIVDGVSLASNVDVVAEELDHRRRRHESDRYLAWVALDGPHDDGHLAEASGDFVGFITTESNESPTVFDRPDRLVICDIYVTKPYRGTGVARDLVDRARRRARKTGCTELELDVAVSNDRALAFYETLGFEPTRYTMVASVAGE